MENEDKLLGFDVDKDNEIDNKKRKQIDSGNCKLSFFLPFFIEFIDDFLVKKIVFLVKNRSKRSGYKCIS